MARKRKSEENKSVIDLAREIGVTKMTDTAGVEIADWIPTGFPDLDKILGGGIPYGRVTELFAKNQSGKSVWAVHMTKQAQKFGGIVFWIDVEGTTTRSNMEILGADPDNNIFHVKPTDGSVMTIEYVTKKIKEIVNKFQDVDIPILLIWDSLAASSIEAELDEDYNSNRVGGKAKQITALFSSLGQSIQQTNIAFLIINQARVDLSNMNSFTGPSIKSPGGEALEHAGTLRLYGQKASQIKEKVPDQFGKEQDLYVGHIFRITIKKSKVSTANRKSELYLISEPFKGLDEIENLYRSSVEQYGFISKGAWRKYVTLDGEDINQRNSDWVPFLESEEGEPIRRELFLRQMQTMFPNGFAPLDNENLDVTKAPDYKDYIEWLENKDKEPKVEVEAEED